ncbi:MAG: phage antirepressor protein, partial [Gammaproteobacteria bacterium]|nr:phage antirepressor protein [Gammaproteobacteria bacterium]
MDQHNKIILFKDKSIRSHWDAELEEWFFSVVDVVAALTDSENPTDY